MSTLTLCSFNMGSTEEETAMENKRKVVIAMDGSEHAMYALQWYKENVHRSTDYVYLIHSIELHHVLHNSKWQYSPQHNNIETVGPLIKEEHIDGEAKPVEAKSAGEGVVHEANELGANVIITGTRGYGKVRRTILGSVSDYIIHHSSVPVIVCHKKKEKH
ncbi:unnamed protein product [Mytilus edulis]|uniref:UspA domain-containing protein n=1 Tax=Mytilus edulis TaxID=6550 RepID=A0A8S3QWC9_MYTED|nr:unnamed protein product [Mytilus edulis]